jgi:hypothetical protein
MGKRIFISVTNKAWRNLRKDQAACFRFTLSDLFYLLLSRIWRYFQHGERPLYVNVRGLFTSRGCLRYEAQRKMLWPSTALAL